MLILTRCCSIDLLQSRADTQVCRYGRCRNRWYRGHLRVRPAPAGPPFWLHRLCKRSYEKNRSSRASLLPSFSQQHSTKQFALNRFHSRETGIKDLDQTHHRGVREHGFLFAAASVIELCNLFDAFIARSAAQSAAAISEITRLERKLLDSSGPNFYTIASGRHRQDSGMERP